MTARDKLITSTIELVRRNGVAGTGLTELLEHSGVSRRSIYLNFTGGKAELVTEATRFAGHAMAELIASADRDPQLLLTTFVEWWAQRLEATDFTAGCPIVAAALGRSPAPEAADAAATAFDEWEVLLADRFRERQVPSATADSLATTIIATVEGAIVMSIAARSTQALTRASTHLTELIDHHLSADSAVVAASPE